MYYVYLIKREKHDFTYIGSTVDLKNRFKEHNAGVNDSTRFYRPFKLVYYEAYLDKEDALSRENKLKHHGSSVGHLKKRIRNSLGGKRKA